MTRLLQQDGLVSGFALLQYYKSTSENVLLRNKTLVLLGGDANAVELKSAGFDCLASLGYQRGRASALTVSTATKKLTLG